jgi:predicted DCC family thiol-disulfide oxidoreductase YuxK
VIALSLGTALGPALWWAVWHHDMRLFVADILVPLALVGGLWSAVMGLLGLSATWLTRGRFGGTVAANVVLTWLGLWAFRKLQIASWIGAALPPGITGDMLFFPAASGAVLLFLLVMQVRSRYVEPITEQNIEALWPSVPLDPHLAPDYHVLVYDGDCAFCAGSVRFILARDDRHTLLFAPRQSAFGVALEARHPKLRGVSSVIWVHGDPDLGETVATRWDALRQIGWYLGGFWEQATRFTGAVIPVGLLDAGYSVIAAVRHRLVRQGSCIIPTPDDRRRLLA